MIINSENGMSKFFTKVYAWMFIGLLVSGGTAYFTANNMSMFRFVSGNFGFILILELIVVILFNALRRKVSPMVAKIMFLVYSIISGLTLSTVFIVYKLGSVGMVFLSAALMFALLAIYGHITKKDLSSFGKMLMFALLAIIIMSIINMFVNNPGISLFLSIVSILTFLGLTAYDINNLKAIYSYYSSDGEELSKAAIYGALDLYLDFINIFLELLNLFGKRND